MQIFLMVSLAMSSVGAPAKWWCTADGYDSQMHLRQVSGREKTTENEARRDAVSTCQSLYSGCAVRSCFNL